jgi:RNA polymerase sigma-70 factor (ECF subfamily)
MPRSISSLVSAPKSSPSSAGLGCDDLAEVARAAALGDPDAAATLILRLGGGILRIVRKVLGPSHPDVDDVAQEAVIAVLAAMQRFRGESSVAHFAHRVALHAALGARRKLNARMRAAQRQALPLDDVADPRCDPHGEVLMRQRRVAVGMAHRVPGGSAHQGFLQIQIKPGFFRRVSQHRHGRIHHFRTYAVTFKDGHHC